MAQYVPDARPTLVINAHENITNGQLRELLLGVEEEGVPVTLNRKDELNPLTLAHTAALESVLDVGIGVSLEYIVVTTEKLPEDQPYMAHFLNASVVNDRIIGGNAARLIKRMPLRPLR